MRNWLALAVVVVGCGTQEAKDLFAPSSGGGSAGGGAGGAAGSVAGGGNGGTAGAAQGGTLLSGGTSGGGSGGSSGGTSGTSGSGGTSGTSGGTGDAGAAPGGAGAGGSGGEGGHAQAGSDSGGAGGEGGAPNCTPIGDERCDGLDNDCEGGADDGDICPEDCYGFADESGHGYMICNPPDAEEVNYSVARAACQAHGFDLVVIETGAENAFLVGVTESLAQGTDTEFWIGATDEVENAWFWVNGDQFYDHTTQMPVGDYEVFWGPNRPNNVGGGEDCAALIQNQPNMDGLWNDLQCDGDPSSYICEAPAD